MARNYTRVLCLANQLMGRVCVCVCVQGGRGGGWEGEEAIGGCDSAVLSCLA